MRRRSNPYPFEVLYFIVFSPPNMSDPCGHVIIVRDGWNIQHVDESPRQEHQRAPVLEHGNGRYQIEKEQHLELGEMSHCRIICVMVNCDDHPRTETYPMCWLWHRLGGTVAVTIGYIIYITIVLITINMYKVITIYICISIDNYQ